MRHKLTSIGGRAGTDTDTTRSREQKQKQIQMRTQLASGKAKMLKSWKAAAHALINLFLAMQARRQRSAEFMYSFLTSPLLSRRALEALEAGSTAESESASECECDPEHCQLGAFKLW